MFNDNSEDGLTRAAWGEYGWPPGALLKLRKAAIKWQKQCKGLTEQRLEQVQLEVEKEKERVELEEETEDELDIADLPGLNGVEDD
jgi:hypothetical protein